jgi:hypothetical protein
VHSSASKIITAKHDKIAVYILKNALLLQDKFKAQPRPFQYLWGIEEQRNAARSCPKDFRYSRVHPRIASVGPCSGANAATNAPPAVEPILIDAP